MNSAPTKILHLEDIRSDADLVKREMQHSQLSFEWLWVKTKSEFELALNNFNPDIILCDHSLPGFTSTEAFNLLKKSGMKIPFILITATVSEEFAVMMMRQGVADYILKDRMQRLPTAVSSALEKWQSKAEKEAYLQEIVVNEKKFRGLIENSQDLILLLSPKLSLVYASPNCTRITGWSSHEMVNNGTSAYVHENDRQGMNATIHQALQTPGKYLPINFRFYHHAGTIIDFDGSVINLISDNAINGIVINIRDVTQRKKTEASLQRSEANLNAIIENSDVHIYSLDKNFRYITFNSLLKNAMKQSFGVDLKVGQRVFDFFNTLDPAEGREWEARYREALSGKSLQFVKEFKVGEHHTFTSFSVNPIVQNNEITGLSCFARDVTAEKLADEKVRQSEARFRVLIENNVDAITLLDENLVPLYRTPSANKMLGLDERAQAAVSFSRVIHADDLSLLNGTLLQAKENPGKIFHFKVRVKHRHGHYIWVEGTLRDMRMDENIKGIIFNYRDISERMMGEEELKQSNERFQILSKATNDAIWDWDIQRDIMTWNHGLEEIFGYSERQILDAHAWWKGRIHAEDHDSVIQQIRECFDRTSVNWSATYRCTCASGAFKHVLDRAYVIYQDGKPVRMIGAMQDITERIEAMREIEKLSLVASKISSAVTITDRLGHVEWVNNSFTDITGYTLEDARGRDMKFLQGPETNLLTLKRISVALKRNVSVSEELINYTKQGQKFWLKLDITPIFNKDGSLRNFISIQSDISKIKEYENSIVSIARELASLIESANVPIFGIDSTGKINEWNHVAAGLTGIDKRDAIGSVLATLLFDPATLPEFDVVLHNLKRGVSTGNLELPVITKDKRKLTLLMSASARRNTSGQIVGGFFVAQNITELSEYRSDLEVKVTERTRELNEALSKERELVDMKSRFISIASHEFRTPLATISIAAGLIRKYYAKLSQEEIEEKLQNIQKQVEHMSYMLDDVLLIEKANAGKLTVQKTEIDLADFFTAISSEVEKSRGNTHSIKITKNILISTILSDEKILRSIFINVLTNAIKFSPGKKYVDVTVSSTSENAVVSVKDYGVGIPEEDVKNLFEPFFRGSNVSAIQGTGLGLSIIRKSLELVKGTISVESTLGEGTKFTITLPGRV